MTPSQFATYVRYKTRTNSTTFPDADIITLMRQRQDEIAEIILKADEDILLVPQYATLVANQRDYDYPGDIISRLKRVEAKLDGTNWIKLIEIDLTEINVPIATEADITRVFNNLQYSNTNPWGARFDLLRKSIYIYSGTITNVTDGLRAYVDTYPTAISDLTSSVEMSEDPSATTHGIPRPLHRLWAMGVIIDYKQSREKPIPLNEQEQNYETYLQRGIETLKHGNLDREVIGDIPYSDGSDY